MEVRKRLEQWFDLHWEDLLRDLEAIVRIPSVARYDDASTPFGPECERVLKEMLRLGESYGFRTENCANRFGTLSLREAEPENEIGIWCHLDVVPAGEGWTLTAPFAPIQKSDYLIGRGADDNKGPALGVMYVLRALEELKLPTKHGLKLFVGTDEEHGMQDVQYYRENYPAQALNLIADCGFPVCYGEKGIMTFDFVSGKPLDSIKDVRAGIADNIIPARADMTIGDMQISGEGIQGHSAFPEGSRNAIRNLLEQAVQIEGLPEYDKAILDFFSSVRDDWGESLGIAGSDEVSGKTSAVPVRMYLTEDRHLVLRVNARTCITADQKSLESTLRALAWKHDCTFEHLETKPSSYFPRENPVVDAITAACNEATGLEMKPYVMSGGTYCKYLERAVGCGFGGLPREKESPFAPGHGGAHQPDEGLYLPNYKKALTVFALALLAADAAM